MFCCKMYEPDGRADKPCRFQCAGTHAGIGGLCRARLRDGQEENCACSSEREKEEMIWTEMKNGCSGR